MKWEIKKIKDVALVTAGQSPEGKYYNANAVGLPFFQGKKEFGDKFIGEAKVWTSFVTKIAEKDDVLMSVRAPVGPVNFAVEKCCIGRGLASIRVKERFDKDFLFLYFKHIENKLTGNTGAVFNSINKGQIEDLDIPIPSFDEQQAIVEKLDFAFDAIEKAKANIEKNIENAKELFQSKLNKIFSQKGEGWEEKKLSEVFIIRPPKNEAKKLLADNQKVTFLPMEDLKVLQKYTTPVKEKQLKEVSGSYTYFAENDLLLAKITPCFENGKMGIAKNLKNNVGFGSSEYIVFREKGEIINEYLFYFFFRDYFRTIGKSLMQGAVGHKRVSKDFIEDLIIPYPNLKIQKEIVTQLDIILLQTNLLKEKYKQKLANLEELKKNILEKAFKGELV